MACSDDKESFTENDVHDLTGYIAIVTGGNSGIGYETTYQLAIKGARVYIASRSQDRVQQAIDKMTETAGRPLDLHFLKIDLENLASIKDAAHDFGQREACVDLLINNAGIMNVPYAITKDGFERQWQVNYIAPHVIDQFFLPYLLIAASCHERQDRVRVVHVSSDLSRRGPSTIALSDPNLPDAGGPLAVQTRYSHSKQATIRDAHVFNSRYAHKGVTAYSVHPGLVRSGLQETNTSLLGSISKIAVGIMGSTPLEVCRNTLFAATSAQAAAIGQGQYFLPVGKLQAKEKWFAETKVNEALWEHGQTQVRRLGVS